MDRWVHRAAVRAVVVVVVGMLAGCSAPAAPSTTSSSSSSSARTGPAECGELGKFLGTCACPDHWHATFLVAVPGQQTTADGFDQPSRIDWNRPKAANGHPYYSYGVDPKMSASVHMHQSGPEQGTAALGPAQFHFEGGGKCVGIQMAFAAVDLDLATGHLATVADSPLAKSNAGGPWSDHGDQSLRFFLQAKEESAWVWSEHPIGDYLHYQLQDGESLLLAFGHYSDAQLQDLEGEVPEPSSRPPP